MKPENVNHILKNNGNAKLIDVREKWEHDVAKLENSILMPLSNFNKFIKELNKEDKLIFYCHFGIRSLKVCNYLEGLGFENLINLEGGIDAWSKEIDNRVPVY